ncbi:response regulator [Kibdelosporangium philippinense]|uniref:Response regulator n=1 Tax=Kibdelosporangium philippinense TaxID=211113 RepID=A0ABS8ZAM3_9PSEU|nr:response regulator [Kibdelosporangium philippinense]MCE7004562.1 response regulator [Kibdelosporangium philippinense]
MATILVAEDDPQIARALQINLSARGYRVIVAHDGETALHAAAKLTPDAVLLDLGLPGIDGCAVIEGLRTWTWVPIIVLSASLDPHSMVNVLDLGADDYVTKPFGMDELLARVRAVVRRSTVTAVVEDPVIDTGSFTVDLSAKKVWRDGASVHLTPTEWAVLEELLRNQGRLVTHRQLLERVWGPEYVGQAHYLRVYVSQLRQKLERNPSQPRHLITEPGMGHRFVP